MVLGQLIFYKLNMNWFSNSPLVFVIRLNTFLDDEQKKAEIREAYNYIPFDRTVSV